MSNNYKSFRYNKRDGKLYCYDAVTQTRRLATLGEKEELEKQESRQLEKLANALFITSLGITIFLTSSKNNYSNQERIQTAVECLLNSEDKSDILDNKTIEYINNKILYNRKEYTTIYHYLFTHCSNRVNPEDLIGIFEIVSRDIYYHQKNNPLIYGCMNCILELEKEKSSGDMSLSIISSILGKEETIYLLLTNQEQKLYHELAETLQLSEEEVDDFVTDLAKLHQISFQEFPLFMRIHSCTKEIMNSSIEIPIEKILLTNMDTDAKKEFIPARNFLKTEEDSYPIRINNDYFNSTSINVGKDFQEYAFLPITLNTQIENHVEQFYNQDQSLLFQIIQNKLEKNEKPIIYKYINNIEKKLKTEGININYLIYGLEKKDKKSFQLLLEMYHRILTNEEINTDLVAEINILIRFMKLEIEPNDVSLSLLLKQFISNTKALYDNQNKPEYASLIDKNGVKFSFDNFDYTLGRLGYPSYEVNLNIQENQTYWEIVIPKEDKNMIPVIRIRNTDGSIKDKELTDFIILEENKNCSDYDIYNVIKLPEEEHLEVYVPIEDYLSTKRKNESRKKYLR